jgi:hypothetical protein
MLDARALPKEAPAPSAPANNGKAIGMDSPDVKAAEREHVVDLFERLQDAEAKQVARAAAKESNFVAWVDQFYSGWGEKIVSALRSVTRAVFARRGLILAEADALCDVLATDYVANSKRELLDLAGKLTKNTLSEGISAAVDGWGRPRLERFVDSITGD